MEMTGLNPDTDRIIELAIVVTDSQVDLVAESPVWVVHQSAEILRRWTLRRRLRQIRSSTAESGCFYDR